MIALQKYSIAAMVCLALLSSCDSDSNDTKPGSDYDRDAMVANYTDNLIIPAYDNLKAKTDAMHSAVTAFVAAPTQATLGTARTAYLQAYTAWQQASAFEFGPASEQLLRTDLNTYPASAQEIEAAISAGNYELRAGANPDAVGFPALDYLLYNATSAEAQLEKYTSAEDAAKRKQYLQAVSAKVQQLVAATHNGWTANGYAASFKQAKGTAVGSAIGSIVNELNQDIDITKRYKVGFPAGKFTSGTAQPQLAEAYYSQHSLELLKETIKAEKAVFMGMSASGTNGPGLDDYLDHVQAPYENGLLSDAIEQQFDAALAAANAVQEPLTQAVTTQPQAVMKVYDELQKLIVLTKTDMPSALGVTIVYNDNDGD